MHSAAALRRRRPIAIPSRGLRLLIVGLLLLPIAAPLTAQNAGDGAERRLPLDPRADGSDIPFDTNADDRGGPPTITEDSGEIVIADDDILRLYACQHRPAAQVKELLVWLEPDLANGDQIREFGALNETIQLATQNLIPTVRGEQNSLPNGDQHRTVDNYLIFNIPNPRWPRVETLLRFVDVPRPQMVAECEIIEINYSRNFQLGASVAASRDGVVETFFRGFDLNYDPAAFLDSQQPGTSVPFQGISALFGNLQSPNGTSATEFGPASLAVRALQQNGQAEILAQPRLLIEEGTAAQINVGEQVYTTDAQVRNNNTVIFRPQVREASTRLEINPLMISRQTVRMRIYAAVREITGFTTAGSAGVSNPIISSRTVNTLQNIEGEQSIIIGGLFLTENRVETRGIPILADIPLLGELFRNHNRTRQRTEVLFLITPHIRFEGIGGPRGIRFDNSSDGILGD